MPVDLRQDYYLLLGVERDASIDHIKRAYRRLAVLHHPDRNPGDRHAEETFKQLSEAYRVLIDPEQRRRYDRNGHAAVHGDGYAADFSSVADVLEGFFTDMLRTRRRRRIGRDIECELPLRFEEAALGSEKQIVIRRTFACEACGGERCEPGRPDMACSVCAGAGVETRQADITVRVPPGVLDGAVRTLRGAGEEGADGRGDLHVTVRVAPHPLLQRQGPDIRCTVPISFAQAALGGSLEVPTLQGRVTMHLPAGTQPGRVFRLRGLGVPVLGGYGRGDQLVQVEIEVPERLTPRQRELIEELDQRLDATSQPRRSLYLQQLDQDAAASEDEERN